MLKKERTIKFTPYFLFPYLCSIASTLMATLVYHLFSLIFPLFSLSFNLRSLFLYFRFAFDSKHLDLKEDITASKQRTKQRVVEFV